MGGGRPRRPDHSHCGVLYPGRSSLADSKGHSPRAQRGAGPATRADTCAWENTRHEASCRAPRRTETTSPSVVTAGRVPTAQTFHDVLARRAAAHPDREAIVDHRHRVTYGELAVRVDRTAAALQSLGLGPGDVVTIQLPNWVEFAYVNSTQFGSWM